MFTQESVILSTGGSCIAPLGRPLPPTPKTATAVDGTHPAGMHCCLLLVFLSCESVLLELVHFQIISKI